MRMAWFAAVGLGALALACADKVDGPLSGLPVTLAERGFDVPPPIVPLVAHADTIVMNFVQQSPTCTADKADAGVTGSALVVTITRVESQAPCPVPRAYTLYSALVSRIPAGDYTVRLDFRHVSGAGTTVSTAFQAPGHLP